MTKKIEKASDLYEMKLHEDADINRGINVLRVPGGWVYSFNCPPDEGTDYAVFVPFDNEYQTQS